MQLELTGLDESGRVETVIPQAREKQLGVGRRGDHHDAVAAPQARLQVERDGVGEGLRVALQLREVAVDRSFGQERTDKGSAHYGIERKARRKCIQSEDLKSPAQWHNHSNGGSASDSSR